MASEFKRRIGAAALVLALASGAASADELINTGNPGGFLGYFGFDLFTGQSVAVAFEPTRACTLDNVKLWIMSNDFDAGGRTYTVTLRSAHPTVTTIPGSNVIESWNVATAAVGWTPVQDVITSVTHPALAAGTRYWIVAESNEGPGQNAVWLSCDGTGTHGVAFNDMVGGNGWQGSEAVGGFPGIIVNAHVAGPARCNPADVAGLGGAAGPDAQLTPDDLIYFLTQFFAGNVAVADLTGPGGPPNPTDGAITVDDLIAFLSYFFAGCP